MKLLLTSSGLSNPSIINAFLELLGKPFADSSLLFITTAANPETDKSYQVDDLQQLQSQNFKSITPYDISQHDLADVKQKIADHDVIWVSGGNTFYLLDQFRKTGLFEIFEYLIKDKIYGGISAGSIIATPSIKVAFVEPADTNSVGLQDFTGLKLVDFEISPHSPGMVTLENTIAYSSNISRPIYALDDQSAIKVDGDKIEVVSEGVWQKFN